MPEWGSEWRFSLTENSYLKFIPLIFPIFAVILSFPALSFEQFLSNVGNTIRSNGSFLLYSLFALLGSTYARFSTDSETTYFTQALMSLALYCSFFVFISIPDTHWQTIQIHIVRVIGITTIIASVGVIINFGQFLFTEASQLQRSNHETAFLLVQAISLIVYSINGFLGKGLLLGLIVVLTALTLKNTAFLTILITIFFILFIPSGREKRFFSKVVVALLLVIVAAIAYSWVEPYLSDGNTYFRTTIYQYRFNQFLASPVWGELFAGETALHYERSLHASQQLFVPTHNDLLDVVVQGGLLGTAMFMGGFLQILNKLLKLRFRLNVNLGNLDKTILTWTFLFTINELVVMAFNPMLGTTDIAYIMWIILAFTQRNIIYTQNKVLSKPL